MSGIPAHGGGRDTTAPDPKVPDSKAPDSKAPDATAAHLGAPDHGELVGSAALLDGCERVLARRIRTLRQGDCDWSMRTSELVSSSVLRILDLTDGGRMPITRGRFMGLLDAIVRSVVVDGIRRRSVRRAAQRVLRAQSEQRLNERFSRAEKLAMEAPVKMLAPLVLCIFPCTFLVLGFPILIRFLASG